MLIVILAVIWIAVLTPIIIRRLRDQDTDRSIVNFHERMARLGGPNPPIVAPAHRLDISDEAPPRELLDDEVNPPTRAPHLRVVPLNATVAQLDSEMSWNEWSLAYSDDPYERVSPVRHSTSPANPRAAAYSRVPSASISSPVPQRSPYGSRTQRRRRRNTLLTLVTSTVLSSIATVAVSSVLLDAVALLSWVAMLGFLALMYYAVSTGLIDSSSDARRVAPRRPQLPIEYNEFDVAYEPAPSRERDDEYERRFARAL